MKITSLEYIIKVETVSYIDCEFLHLMVVAMVTGGPPPPEAVLAQLIVTASLTLVAEPHKRLAVTSLTLHRMKYCK